MKTANSVSIRFWGDLAVFTRPELKVERVSYPIMTPSAARGALEAIFWEPEMAYVVSDIRVVRKGRFVSFTRNEVGDVLDFKKATAARLGGTTFEPLIAGAGAGSCQQRTTLALVDVEYIVTAEVRLTPKAAPPRDSISKYVGEVNRRASKGKCFCRPALGCREFVADFAYEEDGASAFGRRAEELGVDSARIWPDDDLGIMLYDLFEPGERERRLRHREDAPAPRAIFFRARVCDARMECHPDRVDLLFANGR